MKDDQIPPRMSERRDLVLSGSAGRHESTRTAAPPGTGGITPAFVGQSLKRWWALALPAGLILGGTAAAIAWLSFKPTFVSEAWVRIEDRRPYVAFPSEVESKRFVQTQVEMIRSPVVLSQCLSQPGIAQLPEVRAEADPVKWLAKRITTTGVSDSELFRVKFTGPDPVNAAKVVNAVVAAYLEQHAGHGREEAQRVIEVLEAEKSSRVRELQRMQENVRDLTKKVTGKDIIAPRQTLLANPLAALEERLTTAEVEREVLAAQCEAARQALEANMEIGVPQAAIEQAVARDPQIVAINTDLVAMRALVREYEQTSPQHKELEAVRKLSKRIANAEESMTNREAEVRKLATEDIKASMARDQESNVSAMEADLEVKRRLENLLRDRLAAERAEMEKFGDQALNLEFARNEMERAEDVYRRICDRTTALQTEQSARARVSSMSPATPSNLPEKTPLLLVSGAGGALFMLPFVLAVLWEYRVRRVANVDQIHDETRLHVIAEITSLPTRSLLPSWRAKTRFDRHRSTFEESISYLRTSLLLSANVEDLQVIAVASAVSREGKTSVAAQLAANIANSTAQPTLLIDADLRDPDVHEMFGIDLGPGLAEVLAQQASVDDAVVAAWNRRVQVLPAGQPSVSPQLLFNNGTFPSLLQQLRSEYRYIVVDCPPLLAASEALVIAKGADGVLLCTMRDFSRVSQVREARDRLLRAGARPLGVVLSNVSPKSYTAKYGGYNYSYATPKSTDDDVFTSNEAG